MSSTNKTPNYNLPQFLGTDVPAWLGDVNPAYATIDAGMEANKNSAQTAINNAASALNAVNTADSKADKAQSTADGAVSQIATLNDSLTYQSANRLSAPSVLSYSTGLFFSKVLANIKMRLQMKTKSEWTLSPITGAFSVDLFYTPENMLSLTTSTDVWLGSLNFLYSSNSTPNIITPISIYAGWSGTQTRIYINIVQSLLDAISASDMPLIYGTLVFTNSNTIIDVQPITLNY